VDRVGTRKLGEELQDGCNLPVGLGGSSMGVALRLAAKAGGKKRRGGDHIDDYLDGIRGGFSILFDFAGADMLALVTLAHYVRN
jgi:hypothetical protein